MYTTSGKAIQDGAFNGQRDTFCCSIVHGRIIELMGKDQPNDLAKGIQTTVSGRWDCHSSNIRFFSFCNHFELKFKAEFFFSPNTIKLNKTFSPKSYAFTVLGALSR